MSLTKEQRIDISRRTKPGARVSWTYNIDGVNTGIVVSRDGAEIILCCEHPEQGLFDMHIYAEEVTEILEEGCRIPMTQQRLNRLVALAAPETTERKCARNIAERELRWMRERREIVQDEQGKWIPA